MVVITTMILFGAAGASAVSKYRDDSLRRDAVVILEEVNVFGGPTPDSTLQYKIHEGTKVVVVGTRPGWVQIRLPGDLSGWVSADVLERI